MQTRKADRIIAGQNHAERKTSGSPARGEISTVRLASKIDFRAEVDYLQAKARTR
jgi:hypothetical protein